MKRDYRGLISLVIATGLVVTLLIGIAGIIWWGDQISMQGSVVIGMLMGAITILGSAYLGIYLTYFYWGKAKRQRWPGEEDTLEKLD